MLSLGGLCCFFSVILVIMILLAVGSMSIKKGEDE
jgi:hypothetical protein